MTVKKRTPQKQVNRFHKFGGFQLQNIGGFEIRAYGCLLQGELEWFEEAEKKRMQGLLGILKLAKKISQETDVSIEEALEYVQNQAKTDSKKLLDYAAEIEQVVNATYGEEKFRRDVVTMFLQSRLSPSWVIDAAEDLSDLLMLDPGEFEEGKWEPQYTASLPDTILQEICKFIASEKSQGQESRKGTFQVEK